jgi:HAD superfamily hydrolase (TIGR01549 family)
MKIKAIVLDMDGTFLDSRELIYQAMHDVLALRSIAVTQEEMAAVTGQPVQAMYRALAPDHDPAELELEHLKHHEEHLDLLRVYPEAHEALSELSNRYKLGVFTGFDKQTYERLDQFELRSYFESIVENTRYAKHKPDPEGLYLCMKELGVEPAGTVYIGDGVTDMEAGRAAKVAATVGITHGFSAAIDLKAAGADYIIDSLTELAPLIAKIEQSTTTNSRS